MKYMVQGTPRQRPTAEVLALIPAEVAAGSALDRQGLRAALYVAADLSAAWQVFDAESEAAVRAVLATLPLTPYTDYRITPLAGEPAVADDRAGPAGA
jgi:muconolactone delta-isomerase